MSDFDFKDFDYSTILITDDNNTTTTTNSKLEIKTKKSGKVNRNESNYDNYHRKDDYIKTNCHNDEFNIRYSTSSSSSSSSSSSNSQDDYSNQFNYSCVLDGYGDGTSSSSSSSSLSSSSSSSSEDYFFGSTTDSGLFDSIIPNEIKGKKEVNNQKPLDWTSINKEVNTKTSLSQLPPLHDFDYDVNIDIKESNTINNELPPLHDLKGEVINNSKKLGDLISMGKDLARLSSSINGQEQQQQQQPTINLNKFDKIKPLKLPFLFPNNKPPKMKNTNNPVLKMGPLMDLTNEMQKKVNDPSSSLNTNLNCGMVNLSCPRIKHLYQKHHRFYDYIIPRFEKELLKLKGNYILVVPTAKALDDFFMKYGNYINHDISVLERVLAYHIILRDRGILHVPDRQIVLKVETLSTYLISIELNENGTVYLDDEFSVRRDDCFKETLLLTDVVLVPREIRDELSMIIFESKTTQNIMKSNLIMNNSYFNQSLNNSIKNTSSSSFSNFDFLEDDFDFNHKDESNLNNINCIKRDLNINTVIELDSSFTPLSLPSSSSSSSFKSFNGDIDAIGESIESSSSLVNNKVLIDSPIMNFKIYDMNKLFNDYKSKNLNSNTLLENDNIYLDYEIGFDSSDLIKQSNSSIVKFILPMDVDIVKEDLLTHITEFTFNNPYEKDQYLSTILLFNNNLIEIESNIFELKSTSTQKTSIIFEFNKDKEQRLNSISIDYHNKTNEIASFKEVDFDFDNISTTMFIDNELLSTMYSSNLDLNEFGFYLLGVSRVFKKKAKKKKDDSTTTTSDGTTDSTTGTTTTSQGKTKKKGKVARFIQSSKKKLKKGGQKLKKGGKYVAKKVKKPIRKVKEKALSQFQYETVPLNYRSGLTGATYISGFTQEEQSSSLPQKDLYLKIELLDSKTNHPIKTIESRNNKPIFYINTKNSKQHILVYDVSEGISKDILDSNFIAVRVFNPISRVLENFEFQLSQANVQNLKGEGEEVLQSRKFLKNRLQFTFIFTDGQLNSMGLWFEKEGVPSNYKSNFINNYKVQDIEIAFSKIMFKEPQLNLNQKSGSRETLLYKRFNEIYNSIYNYNTNYNNSSNNHPLGITNKVLDKSKIDNLINYLTEFNYHIQSFANINNIKLSSLNENDFNNCSSSSLSSSINESKSYAYPEEHVKGVYIELCHDLGSLDNDCYLRSKLAFDTIINGDNLNFNNRPLEEREPLLKSIHFISSSLLYCILTIKEGKLNHNNKQQDLNQLKSTASNQAYKILMKTLSNI